MDFFQTLLSKTTVAYFLGGLVSLITITNPLSKIPLFLSLTTAMDPTTRKDQAAKACRYALMILVVSLFAGVFILRGFGISFGALRIAGGLTIAIMGYRMLFNGGQQNAPIQHGKSGIAFFPLAMPGISGPGTIAVVIGMSTEIAELRGAAEVVAYAATVASMLVTIVVIWLTLRSAKLVSAWIGEEGMDAMSRLMGFLMVCVGVQFIGSGIKTFISTF
jgi:multiple antibiotic resistance protein